MNCPTAPRAISPRFHCPSASQPVAPVAGGNCPQPVARGSPANGLGGSPGVHRPSCRRCPARLCSGVLVSGRVAGWPAPAPVRATRSSKSTRVSAAIRQQVHPVRLPRPDCSGCQMRSRRPSLESFVFHRSGLWSGPPDLLCPLLTSPRYSAPIARHPASIARSTGEISRGKTRYLPCIDAGFTKCTPTAADGGLRSCVPARPRCITPHIRFLFIAPQFRIELPSDPILST